MLENWNVGVLCYNILYSGLQIPPLLPWPILYPFPRASFCRHISMNPCSFCNSSRAVYMSGWSSLTTCRNLLCQMNAGQMFVWFMKRKNGPLKKGFRNFSHSHLLTLEKMVFGKMIVWLPYVRSEKSPIIAFHPYVIYDNTHESWR